MSCNIEIKDSLRYSNHFLKLHDSVFVSYAQRSTLYALRASSAFTLIELLLVIVLLAIVTAIVLPSFVRSIQGQRLSTAARTLSTVARYARSMAVLKQTDLVLTFNLANGQVDLVSSNTSLPSFSRVVHGVRLAEVAVEGAEPVQEGVGKVQFRRNGVCSPFVVMIEDRNGDAVRLAVDALGRVKSKEFGGE